MGDASDQGCDHGCFIDFAFSNQVEDRRVESMLRIELYGCSNLTADCSTLQRCAEGKEASGGRHDAAWPLFATKLMRNKVLLKKCKRVHVVHIVSSKGCRSNKRSAGRLK